jgi:hypothetical protein
MHDENKSGALGFSHLVHLQRVKYSGILLFGRVGWSERPDRGGWLNRALGFMDMHGHLYRCHPPADIKPCAALRADQHDFEYTVGNFHFDTASRCVDIEK